MIIKGSVIENSSAVFLARIYDNAGSAITQAGMTSVSYSVFDKDDPTGAAIVDATALTVSAVVFDTLQTSDTIRWTTDTTGYNFAAAIPGTAFPSGKTNYRVEFKFTDTASDVFYVALDVQSLELWTA